MLLLIGNGAFQITPSTSPRFPARKRPTVFSRAGRRERIQWPARTPQSTVAMAPMVLRMPSGSQVLVWRHVWFTPMIRRSIQFERFFAGSSTPAPAPGTGTRIIRAQYPSRRPSNAVTWPRRPVARTPVLRIIDEEHPGDGDTAERVERQQALRRRGGDGHRQEGLSRRP